MAGFDDYENAKPLEGKQPETIIEPGLMGDSSYVVDSNISREKPSTTFMQEPRPNDGSQSVSTPSTVNAEPMPKQPPEPMGQPVDTPKANEPIYIEAESSLKTRHWILFIVLLIVSLIAGFYLRGCTSMATQAEQKYFDEMNTKHETLVAEVKKKDEIIKELEATIVTLETQLVSVRKALSEKVKEFAAFKEWALKELSANENYLNMLKYNVDRFYNAPWGDKEGRREICFTTATTDEKCYTTTRPYNELPPQKPVEIGAPK